MAKHFTKQEIDEIRSQIATYGVRDMEFPETDTMQGEDYLAIVQDGENKRISGDNFRKDMSRGPRGESTYEIAVRHGYTGTEEEWLADPVNGAKGNGIKSVEVIGEYSSDDSATNTYLMTFDNDEEFYFQVKNGKGITSVSVVGEYSPDMSATNTYRISLSDNTHFDFEVKNAKGITSIDSSESTADSGTSTYTIHLSDDTQEVITVKNGTGISSVQQTTTSLVDGGTNIVRVTLSDGRTMDIEIKNGNQGNSGYSGAAGELEVVNNLTEGGTTAALSAEQGKILKEGLDAKDAEILEKTSTPAPFTQKNYSLLSNGKFGTSTDYKHAAIAVNPGDYYIVTNNQPTDATDVYTRYAFATSSAATSGGDVPLVEDTTVQTLNAGESRLVEIPAGCTYLLVNYSTTSATWGYDVKKVFGKSDAQITETMQALDAKIDNTDAAVRREIGDISYSEEKQEQESESGYVAGEDGSIHESQTARYVTIALNNAKLIRFTGAYTRSNEWQSGYAFYDEEDDLISSSYWDYGADENGKKEYFLMIPEGAVTFKTTVVVSSFFAEDDFYCYLQFGDSIADSLLSPITKFDLIGTGNTIAKKELFDLAAGHRYRLYINDWDITDIYTSGNYSLLSVYATNIQTYLFNEYVNASASRLPYYDFIVPAEYSGKVVIGIRAAVNSVVKLRLEDITVVYAEIKERKQADYEKGLTVTYDFNDLVEYEKVYENKWIYSRDSSLYKDVYTTNSDSYPKNIKIPLPEGIKMITYTAFPTSNQWGSVVLDENEKVVNVYSNSGSSITEIKLNLPSSAKYFIYAIRRDMRRTVTLKFSKASTEDRVDFLLERLKTAKNITGETITIPRNSNDFYALFSKYDYGQYSASSDQMGKNITNVLRPAASAGYSNYLIPVEGWKKIGFRQYQTTGYYGSLFLDEDMVVVGRYYNRGGERDTIQDVPATAKWLFYSAGSVDNDYVTFYAGDTMESALELLDSRVDDLAEGNSSVSQRTGAAPRYVSGALNEQGGITSNAKFVTTEAIFGNFSLGVADGFRIYSGSLVDRSGNMVSYQHQPPMSDIGTTVDNWSPRLTFSSLNMPGEYGYRFVIGKADGTDIAEGETIITSFVSMNDAPVHRWVPDGLAKYDVAQRRIEYMQKLLWTPLSKVPDGSSSSADVNTYFCLPGHLMQNMPYSDLGFTRKFVPANVSIRTFLTAAKNKRSLLYTENLFNGTSGYGLSYTGASRCGSYYGCACNAFTAWVMGMKTIYISSFYGSNAVPGLSTVSNPSADNVQPLDLIWNQGHISIISDIFKDDYGKVKYIVWAEMTTPYCKRTIYTPEKFMARIVGKECTVHRWNGWSNLTEPPTITGYNMETIGGTQCDVPYCEDIMCFAGDYASFADGEKIVLNARRGETYTGVLLYKDDVLLQTIDIGELPVDGDDGEDWVRVDLSSLNLAAGKYKACLSDGTNTTGYTYFEVIGITFSAALNSNGFTITFAATGGTPVSFEGCSTAGWAYAYHQITAADIEAGTISKTWSASSSYAKLYLLVQGDYGTVCKIIDYPTS